MSNLAGDNLIFWALWAATVVVVVHQLVKAAASPRHILGYVPPFCMMFAYFYILQAAIVAANLSDRLPSGYLAEGQAIALFSLIAVLWGWYKGSTGSTRVDPNERILENPQALWYMSLTAMFIGIVGEYSFFAAGLDSEDSSGYWYMLCHIFYPGLAICVALISRRAEFRGGGPALLLLALAAVFMFPWVIAGRRGPLFPFMVVLLYSYYLMRPHLVNRVVIIGGLALTGLAMLVFVMTRDYSDRDRVLKFNERRFQSMSAIDIVTAKAYSEGDNEYFYHCINVGALIETDRFQWMTGYLSLSVHWIPRAWWPDKPPLAHGWLDPLSKEEVYQVTGVLMSNGASVGGVAETFIQFAWFTPLFWFAIGWSVGKVYLYGRRHPNRVGPFVYIGILAGSHWLISQGFAAAFVPVMIYVTVPLLIFMFASQRIVRIRRPRARRLAAPAPQMALRSAS